MTRRWNRCVPLLLLAVAGRAGAVPPDPPGLPDSRLVLAAITRCASAEVARLGASVDASWISATFLVAAEKLAGETDIADVAVFAADTARRFHYALQGDGAPVHLINADDQAIGDLYQSQYLKTGAPGALMPLRQRLEYTLPFLVQQPAPRRLVWWWSDALFMAPPVLANMSAITGDPRYLDAMDVQWWRVHERLYNREYHLFARDERFKTHYSNGKPLFWSRGEGWVMAGTARVLEAMPAAYPSRSKYVRLFQEMAAAVAALQGDDGLWRANLLDPSAHPEPETSGSAFFTYALAFGINHGLLDRAAYLPRVLKGWAGLNRYVLPNGVIGQVQATGDQPVPTAPDNTGLYASGAFILAGIEVLHLGRPASVLPLPMPAPARLRYDTPNWPATPLPPTPTDADRREHARREAERQAVRDLQFDPLTDAAGDNPSNRSSNNAD